MPEKELYRELGRLTGRRNQWKENIPHVGALLHGHTTEITAKALWLLGEMGLVYPGDVKQYVPSIAAFLTAEASLLRERALNALGRIGRADFDTVKPYLRDMLALSRDSAPNVRLSLIWASENIAVNTPAAFEDCMELFAGLLNDLDDRVRIEAPEIFRVLGKRKPDYVRPYLEKLAYLMENDHNPVVRVHSGGAIKAVQMRR